ncbi:MarR family winged helix-turn-helix transcriptional regulator [Paenibacillus sp. NPDC057967]|uniref:MarR family winged helix-turn-helix transcriptional regulator n=1 Tax=Paenibacillus sp. NPDC057967 TaxID=3346293 RepID=UPI0036DE1B78
MNENWRQHDKGGGESHGPYISAIYRHMQVLISAELAPFRIGSGQYIFLMAVAFRQPVTQKELSETLLIDKTTTAKAIAKLEAEGYVRREANPADNRYQLLYLTDAGQDVVPRVQEALARVKNKTRKGIGDEEYDQLLCMLQTVLRNLTEKEETEG